jgi:hypothetical protein
LEFVAAGAEFRIWNSSNGLAIAVGGAVGLFPAGFLVWLDAALSNGSPLINADWSAFGTGPR